MRKLFSIFFFAALSLSSCSNNPYEYWELDHFTICDKINYSSFEDVKLLYASNGEPSDLDAYNQYIAIVISTGDTINILTNHRVPLDEYSGDERFGVAFFEDGVRYDRVCRDPAFDEFADNEYCTYYGFVGKNIERTEEEVSKELGVNVELIRRSWVLKGNNESGRHKGDYLDLKSEHACMVSLEDLNINNAFVSYEIIEPNILKLSRDGKFRRFVIEKLSPNELILSIEVEGELQKFQFN